MRLESDLLARTGVRAEVELGHRFFVCVWPWHLEMRSLVVEHRVHDEHGRCNQSEGSADRRELVQRRRVGSGGFRPIDSVLADSPYSDLAALSRRAATGEAAVPRSGCSTAWAAT